MQYAARQHTLVGVTFPPCLPLGRAGLYPVTHLSPCTHHKSHLTAGLCLFSPFDRVARCLSPSPAQVITAHAQQQQQRQQQERRRTPQQHTSKKLRPASPSATSQRTSVSRCLECDDGHSREVAQKTTDLEILNSGTSHAETTNTTWTHPRTCARAGRMRCSRSLRTRMPSPAATWASPVPHYRLTPD